MVNHRDLVATSHLFDGAAPGILAYLEGLLLVIAVTGLIPFDARYNWLSLATYQQIGTPDSRRIQEALHRYER